jgi:hypothetical protein
VACRGEEAKGDRAEALAKAGVTLRRSLARHSSQERRRVPLGFAKDAPRLGAGCFTIVMKWEEYRENLGCRARGDGLPFRRAIN